MTFFTYLCTFLLTFSCIAQTKETKEDFINAIHKTFVDSSFNNYLLFEESSAIPLDRNGIARLHKELSQYIPDSTLQHLIDKAFSDTLAQKWDCTLINSARCISSDSTHHLLSGVFGVKINPKWSKRRNRRESAKQLKIQREEFYGRTAQERQVYYFSRPIFDNTNEYAIISMSYVCGNLCAYGCTFLFQKIKGEWRKVAKARCWES
ncbi:MAG TPA: hypothetical protein VF691_16205 [Cytophagaceae bacterium]|jgi:hypothetical protein